MRNEPTVFRRSTPAGHRARFTASIAALLAIVVGVLPAYAQNNDDNDRDNRQNFNRDNDKDNRDNDKDNRDNYGDNRDNYGDNRQPVNSCPARLQVFGLTDDGRLVRFNSNSPGNTTNIGTINGLQNPDTGLIGIDFRVQNKLLYGVGNAGGVYTINTRTAQVTFVNRLNPPPQGTSFGVDFNPAADALRVVSDIGQNLRHNVNTGVTVADGTLTYTPPPGDPVAAMGVTGSAYTNNDLNPNTAVTLFAIDTNLDQVAIQSPANNGILVATGKLGVDAGLPAGFDIYSRIKNDVTVQLCAFATLNTAGSSSFYRISLLTGAATRVGGFDAPVVDIALPLEQR